MGTKYYFFVRLFYRILKDFKHLKLLLKMARVILLIALFSSLHCYIDCALFTDSETDGNLEQCSNDYTHMCADTTDCSITDKTWCQLEALKNGAPDTTDKGEKFCYVCKRLVERNSDKTAQDIKPQMKNYMTDVLGEKDNFNLHRRLNQNIKACTQAEQQCRQNYKQNQ